tara:strand:- start:2773 stop:3879 length:1107 start_codon:yes stop_codon:yes gene_type:complete
VAEESDNQLKFLFFGELPPSVVHGVSISNKINTDILSKIGELHIIEEQWSLRDHERFAFRKIRSTFQSIGKIWRSTRKESPTLFYSVLYVSLLGVFKNLLSIIAVKIGNRNTHLLLHVHRSDLKEYISGNFIYRLFIRFFNRCGVTFIVLSETQKEEIKKYLNKIEVLYNAIDESEIYPLRITRSDSNIRLLYISNYIREKGILDLLNAIKTFKIDRYNFQLDCYGGFTDVITKAEINKLKKGYDHININKPVFGKEKNKVLNSADIVILPSHNEGLPLVLLEALRLKKPFIVTKVGYISEILGEDYPLYCKVKNIESIRNAIRESLRLSENNADKFKSYLNKIYQKINYEQHRNKLEKIVHETLTIS